MFSTFDMKSFGAALRTIRESHKLTRIQVSDLIGLHTDTLRKIESGAVIPKYESLEMLSHLYRVDTFNLFRIHRCNSNLENIYESLDNFLIHDKTEKILELKNQILADPNSYKLLFLDEYYLLKLFIESVIVFHENKTTKLVELLINLEKHIDIHSLKSIDITQMSAPLLTRLANVLALIHMRLSHFEISIYILESILDIVHKDTSSLYFTYKFEVKYCYSLSYCYFLQSDYINSLQYADKGIEVALKNQSMYMLYILYSRKGASEYKLDKDTYKDSFVKCIHFLDISGDESVKKKYIDIIRNKYIHDFKI